MQQPPHTIIDVDAEMPTLGDSPSADLDAFTAASLHERRHIAVTLSTTDGKQLRLWYNTKTLIIIAQRKGRWTQPPHFRTDMDDAMVREIERIEGRRIDVATPLTRFGHAGEANASGLDGAGRPSSSRHVDIDNWDAVATALHHGDVLDTTALRAVAAVDRFVGARMQEAVYVCPDCYKEALSQLEEHREARIRHERQSLIQHRPLDDGERELTMGRFDLYASRARAPPCPLEVIGSLDPEARVQMCFARAAAWRKHLDSAHGTKDSISSDWTVHKLVAKRLADKSDTTGRFARGEKRYWAMNAKWRTHFYNELRRSTAAVSGPSRRSSGKVSPCPEPAEGRNSTTPAVSQPRKQHRAEVEAAAVHAFVIAVKDAADTAAAELDEPTDLEFAEEEIDDAASGASDGFLSACSYDAYAHAADDDDDGGDDKEDDELLLPSSDPWMERDDYYDDADDDKELDELPLSFPSVPWMEHDDDEVLTAWRQDAARAASNSAPQTPVLVICH